MCFLDFLKSVRLPDGYASNISRCVTSDGKLTNLKTHDSHILLQKFLPIGIVGLLCKDVRVAIIELSNFFRRLCARTLLLAEIQELKKGIVVILCKFEKIFPPSFFTIMVHLRIHLPDQALLGGPIASRWMYSVERCLGTYKGYVRNAALPEDYVVDEALTFLSLYVKGLETKFTRPERNIDVICNESSSFALFKARLRCFGTSYLKFLSTQSDALQWYILNNCHEDIKAYLDEHMDILKQNFSNNLEQLQARIFPTWFKSKMEKMRHEGSSEATDDMYSLALGPFDRYTSWTSCIVNGLRFHSQCRDDTLRT
ncbi:hypothetical protein OSB04_017081 [Centaurea solstitialis]|uniref:DUF4218 domain-containing protein n=1 Tax=Centaurea solstitialis TaxID=347529 RepID=A0AA38TFE9_9ASTR|nr:hypothetical protein OSB04_017081 [Centaurea solstitialis]